MPQRGTHIEKTNKTNRTRPNRSRILNATKATKYKCFSPNKIEHQIQHTTMLCRGMQDNTAELNRKKNTHILTKSINLKEKRDVCAEKKNYVK